MLQLFTLVSIRGISNVLSSQQVEIPKAPKQYFFQNSSQKAFFSTQLKKKTELMSLIVIDLR